LVGEHVDYADGVVACVAVRLRVAVAIRPSADGRWRVVASAGRRAERDLTEMAGDVADRPLAVVLALREVGIALPPLEMAIAADLPEGAGLSSSAALCCAVAVAALRLSGVRLPPAGLADVALVAERDIVGVPCGPLDQRAIVGAPAGGALLLDCRDLGETALPWIDGLELAVCDTGAAHDVGGPGYRRRREEAEAALRALGAGSWRDLSPGSGEVGQLPPPLDRRGRHIVTETARATAAGGALTRGDASALGKLMSASHASLRDDYEVSTPALDAAASAATAVEGCLGARLVGAGFGGSVVALVRLGRGPACLEAMARASAGAGGGGGGGGGGGQGPPRGWVMTPGPGLAVTCADVLG
jgi:galactokinase